MSTDFVVGDVIVCVSSTGYYIDGGLLTEGKEYTVLSIEEVKDDTFVLITGDKGFKIHPYANRFVLKKNRVKHWAVLNGIKRIESTRQALGYKY
jgi:hypothetical protein